MTWKYNEIIIFCTKFSKIDLDSRAQNYVPLGALNAAHAHNNTIVLIAMSNIYLHTCISYFVIQKDFWKWGRYIQIVKFFKIMTNSNYITLYSTMVIRVKFPFHTFKGCRNLNEIVLSYNQSRYCLN